MEPDNQARVWGLLVGNKGNQLEIYNSKTGPFPPEPGSEGLVAIGWPAIGDLRMFKENYLDFVTKFRVVYSHKSERTFKTTANMPWNFAFTMNIGDWVICPSSASGYVLVGKISGAYKPDFHDEMGLYGKKRPDFIHTRNVIWEYVIEKSDLRYSKLNRIGQLTLSQQDIPPEDLLEILKGE